MIVMVCKHTSGTIEGEEINCWGIYVGVYLLHLSEATLFNNFEMNDDNLTNRIKLVTNSCWLHGRVRCKLEITR